MAAGLLFRVGRADETLARSGITHLIEHLALHRHGLTDYHSNGATGMLETHFYVQGSDDDIVAFLTGVCDSLFELPLDRLETEKAILRTEEAGRGRGANNELPLWRYGAQGYGLISYPEWGLDQLHPEDVRQWTQTWFTRENAALWIAGDHVPADLRLRLRSGARRALPRPSSALPVTPAYFASGNGVVVLDAVVRRRTAAAVATKVLERELFRSLRQEGGLSYTAATAYDGRGDGFATITALADALPDKQDAVLGGFIDVLAQLRVGRIEEAAVNAVITKAQESASDDEAEAARLPGHAADLLAGHPITTVEELRDELRAVTVTDVHEAAVEALGSALLQVPQQLSADWAGFSEAPTHSTTAVNGAQYSSREHGLPRLVIGATGVSLLAPSGPATVNFHECAAKLAWPDGARRLIGLDGIVVHIEPSLYAMDPSALAAIDAGVHPSVAVWMPPRKPDAIPTPDASAPAPGKGTVKGTGKGTGKLSRAALAVVVICAVLVTLWTGICLITTAVVITDKTIGPAKWFVLVMAWLIDLLFATPIISIMRRRR
jgi:zinc protease